MPLRENNPVEAFKDQCQLVQCASSFFLHTFGPGTDTESSQRVSSLFYHRHGLDASCAVCHFARPEGYLLTMCVLSAFTLRLEHQLTSATGRCINTEDGVHGRSSENIVKIIHILRYGSERRLQVKSRDVGNLLYRWTHHEVLLPREPYVLFLSLACRS